jgi:serine/threonine protein kinase
MDAEQWQHIRRIFHQAVDLPSGERGDFVLRAAAGDESLRIEVESLLASHDGAGSFIEPPGDRVTTIVLDEVTADQIGRRVGSYKIVREIGRGGMGSVYLGARADDEFSKRAAIKLIRTGMNTDFVVRRFLSERQILANLDHPNIARLLDGGTNEDGLPYFVMEYVEGQPIREYCDSLRLSTDERLRLFGDVCSAVHYAHQNLVIHRDIKPGNILVTADGTVKLLDFGIAKLLGPGPGRDETEAVARVMTPAYASPEQVKGDPITTASDVYSLGVLLYELLTGHRPYRVASSSPIEIIQAICEQEPDRPSTAVARVETIPTGDGDTRVTVTPESVSKERGSQPDKLRRELEGDLDNIVLKAMRKEPQRRYASAEQLSEDIRRYLEGLPVIARKDTFGYRAAKFIQRHKTGVAVAVLVVIALLSATIVTSWQARVARHATEKAEIRFAEQRRLANSLMTEVQSSLISDPYAASSPYAAPTQRLLAQKSLEYLNNLAKDAVDDPTLLGELAAAYSTEGYFQAWTLQDNPGALVSYEKAIELCIRRAALEPNSFTAKRKLGDALGAKVESLNLLGRSEEALQIYGERLSLEQEILEAEPEDPKRIMRLAETNQGSGDTLRSLMRTDEANARFRTAVELALQAISVFKERARQPEERVDLSSFYLKQGDMYEELSELQNAAESYRTASVIAEAVHNEHPEIAQALRNTSSSHWYLGQILDRLGDYPAALESFRVSLKTVMKAGEADRSHYGEAKYSIVVGKALCKVGEKQQGASLIRHGVKLTLDEMQTGRESSASRYYGGELLSWAGEALNLAGKKNEAIAVYLEAIKIVEEAAQKSPADSNPLLRLANFYESLGNLYAGFDGDTRRIKTTNRAPLTEAHRWYQKGLDILRETQANFNVSLASSQEQVNGLREKLADCEARLQ